MHARPCGTLRRSRFFLNSFLRLAGFAGPPGVAAAVSFGSLATLSLVQNNLDFDLLLTRRNFLLGCHRALARTFSSTRVRMRALAAHRQIAAVAQPTIALGLNQPPDV